MGSQPDFYVTPWEHFINILGDNYHTLFLIGILIGIFIGVIITITAIIIKKAKDEYNQIDCKECCKAIPPTFTYCPYCGKKQ